MSASDQEQDDLRVAEQDEKTAGGPGAEAQTRQAAQARTGQAPEGAERPAEELPEPASVPEPRTEETPEPASVPEPRAEEIPEPASIPEPRAEQTPEPASVPEPRAEEADEAAEPDDVAAADGLAEVPEAERAGLAPWQARRVRIAAASVLMVAAAAVLAVRLATRSSVLVVGVYGLLLILCGIVIELSRRGRTRLGSWVLGAGVIAALAADWVLLP